MISASNQSYTLMVSFGDDEYVLILESVDSYLNNSVDLLKATELYTTKGSECFSVRTSQQKLLI